MRMKVRDGAVVCVVETAGISARKSESHLIMREGMQACSAQLDNPGIQSWNWPNAGKRDFIMRRASRSQERS
jgi:hypothetical protein